MTDTQEKPLTEIGVLKRDCADEDWKTAIARNKRTLKKGERVKVLDSFFNLYGTFLRVEAEDGTSISIRPYDIEKQQG